MKPIQPCLLATTLLWLVACHEQQPVTSAITLYESDQRDGCFYAGQFYSPGAVKSAEQVLAIPNAEPASPINPEGPYMRCVIGGNDGYHWVVIDVGNEFAFEGAAP